MRAAPKSLFGRLVPVGVLLLAFAIFSGYTVLTKAAIQGGTDPTVLCFLREIVATSALLPAAWFTTQRNTAPRRRFWPKREDLGDFVVLGAVMVYGVQMLSALAISRLSPINYSLWAPLVPLVTLALALLTGYEPFDRTTRMSWAKVAGIVIAVVGAAVVATGAAERSSSAKELRDVITCVPRIRLMHCAGCTNMSVVRHSVILRQRKLATADEQALRRHLSHLGETHAVNVRTNRTCSMGLCRWRRAHSHGYHSVRDCRCLHA